MEGLREWLAIDRNSPSGLIWINDRKYSKAKAGSAAFTSLNTAGYYRGGCLGRQYLAHRVVFFLYYGFLADEIDHIDGNRKNNIPENLREVSRSENQHNRVASGYCFDRRANAYRAQIRDSGKMIYLGLYGTEEDAKSAYLNAKKKLHPTAPSRCYEELNGNHK